MAACAPQASGLFKVSMCSTSDIPRKPVVLSSANDRPGARAVCFCHLMDAVQDLIRVSFIVYFHRVEFPDNPRFSKLFAREKDVRRRHTCWSEMTGQGGDSGMRKDD